MEVILLEKIGRLGVLGDVVRVKNGYGRNYLIPTGKALRATKENVAKFEARRAELESENDKKRDTAEAQVAKLVKANVVLLRQAGEDGKLFGSVSSRDIAKVTAEKYSMSVDHTMVHLAHPIKFLGLHPVEIMFHPEVVATITVNVARTEAEAEVALKAATTTKSAPKAELAVEDLSSVESTHSDEEASATAE